MRSRIPTVVLAGLLLFLGAGDGAAHNGEYVDPEANRPPPSLTPGPLPGPTTGTPVPTGRPTPTPNPGARGVPTGRNRPPVTATPDSVEQVGPLRWKEVWELLRRSEPTPPPSPDPVLRGRVRAALRAALEDESVPVRRSAVFALARLLDRERVVRAVREDPALHRSEALLAPGLALLDRPSGEEAAEAGAVLRLALEDPKADALARACAALGLGLTGGSHAGTLHSALSGEKNPELRTALLLALGFTRHPGVREVLVTEALPPPKDSKAADRPAHRVVAVHALSLLPGEEVLTDLLRRLADESPFVGSAAALSLVSRIPERPAARSALRSVAATGAPRPRSAALLALARVGDPRVPDLCRKILNDRVLGDSPLGGIAALCLGLVRSVADGPALFELFRRGSASPELRSAAAVAVGLVKPRGIAEDFPKALSKIADAESRAFGLTGYALLAGERAGPPILEALKRERSEAVRRLLVIALGYAGGEEAEAGLVKALGDSFYVNLEAGPALYRLNPERAVTEVLGRLTDGKTPSARVFAARVFGLVMDPRVPDLFAETLLGIGLDRRAGVGQLMMRHGSLWMYNR